MDEALLSEAIYHGFLFRKLTLGGEYDGTMPDYSRQIDKNKALSVSSETQNSALNKAFSQWRNLNDFRNTCYF